MKNESTKFLEFNDHAIYYNLIDGEWWVAIKPICEALNVNYNRQFQNLKNDEILNQLFAKQQMVGADDRMREMVSIPEKYIYGWLFSIRSASEDLKAYKLKCYEILYDYFHGTITRRQRLLVNRLELKNEKQEIINRLQESDDYKRLKEIDNTISASTKTLNKLDKDLAAGQMDMFEKETN